MTLPVVTLVGRVNVGKSSLFNAILGRQRAVVDPAPGVTRDQIAERIRHGGTRLSLVDTAGVGSGLKSDLESGVDSQTTRAIEQSDYLILVVDHTTGLHPIDQETARRIRHAGKRFAIAVNKIDRRSEGGDPAWEFYAIPSDGVFPVSAAHRRGVQDLLDHVISRIGDADRQEIGRASPSGGPEIAHAGEKLHFLATSPNACSVAFVGRPNAGKSTLINAVVGSARMLTSPSPGTTRDRVDEVYYVNNRKYVLTDSAGIRRKSRVRDRLEEKSIGQALRAIARSDVTLLVMDIRDPGTAQDARLAHHALAHGRGLILVLTQSDLVDDENLKRAEWAVRSRLRRLDFCPLLTVSGLTGEGTHRIFPIVDRLRAQMGARIEDGVVRESLKRAVAGYQPPRRGGRTITFKRAAQVAAKPPTFVVEMVPFRPVPEHYRSYLVHQFKRDFHLQDIPIRLHFRPWRNPKDPKSTRSRPRRRSSRGRS